MGRFFGLELVGVLAYHRPALSLEVLGKGHDFDIKGFWRESMISI